MILCALCVIAKQFVFKQVTILKVLPYCEIINTCPDYLSAGFNYCFFQMLIKTENICESGLCATGSVAYRTRQHVSAVHVLYSRQRPGSRVLLENKTSTACLASAFLTCPAVSQICNRTGELSTLTRTGKKAIHMFEHELLQN